MYSRLNKDRMYSNRGPDGKPFARLRGGLGRSTRHEKDTTTPRPPSIPTESRAYLAHISRSSSLVRLISWTTFRAPPLRRPLRHVRSRFTRGSHGGWAAECELGLDLVCESVPQQILREPQLLARSLRDGEL